MELVANHIHVARGHRIVFDAVLAALYGVDTRRLNEQVRRNLDRFPADFMFQLSHEEAVVLMSQSATSSPQWGGRRKPPLVFTEHGALMAATVLNSTRAVEVSVYVVRAFVKLRETLAKNEVLAARLAELELKTEELALRQDRHAADTRLQLKKVFEAIRELMTPRELPRRPIGFVTEESAKRR